MGLMPTYARPPLDYLVEAAIEAYGNRVSVAIIGVLARTAPATRGQLAKAVGAGEQTVLRRLRILLEYELITADPPPDLHTPGQRVVYTLNKSRVRDLYLVLGAQLGLR